MGEKTEDRKQEAQAAMTAAYGKPAQQPGDSRLHFLARNGAGRPSRWQGSGGSPSTRVQNPQQRRCGSLLIPGSLLFRGG